MAKLVASRDGEVEVHPLGGGTVSIGRDAECGIRLDSTQVSRRHCRLDPLPDGRFRLVDQVSTNGTYLNGQRVSSVVLEDFDRLQIGNTELIFVGDDVDPDDALEFRFAGEELEDERGLLESGATWSALRFDRAGRRYAFKERVLTLSLAAKDVLSEEDTLPLLTALLEEVLRFTRFERGEVLLAARDEGGGLEQVVRLPDDATPAASPDPALLGQLVDEAVRTRRIVERAFPAMADSGVAPPGALAAAPLRNAVCVPLDTGPRRGLVGAVARLPTDPGDTIRATAAGAAGDGVAALPAPAGALLLATATPVDPLATPDRRLLELAAGQAAIALQRAQLYRQATVDHLTQLTNRACMTRLLEEALQRAASDGAPLAALMFDLDHFKAVNDTYGHQAGDEVLRRVAQRVRRVLRKGDQVSRWGGEEFLVFLPGVSSGGAQRVAAKIARAISSHPFGEARVHVTASVGLAVFPFHAHDTRLLLERADQALYAAKAMGRNRYVAYQAQVDDAPAPAPADAPAELAGGRDGAGRRTSRLKAAAWEEVGDAPTQAFPTRPRSSPWLWCPPLEPVALQFKPMLTIGRDPTCDLLLPHLEVSLLHAVVRTDSDGLVLEDQGTLNGIYLNGLRINAPEPLRAGDTLLIGPYRLEVLAAEPSLEDVIAATEGRGRLHLLEEEDLEQLLARLARRGFSGAVQVRAGGLRGAVVLRAGRPDSATLEGGARDDADPLATLSALRAGLCRLVPDDELEPPGATDILASPDGAVSAQRPTSSSGG